MFTNKEETPTERTARILATIEPRDCFLSHHQESEKDRAKYLAEYLERNGLTTWYCERDEIGGLDYTVQCTDAVKKCKILILLWSKEADESNSFHIQAELNLARNEGKSVIPVILEPGEPERLGYLGTGGGAIHWREWFEKEDQKALNEILTDIRIHLGMSPGNKWSDEEQEALNKILSDILIRLGNKMPEPEHKGWWERWKDWTKKRKRVAFSLAAIFAMLVLSFGIWEWRYGMPWSEGYLPPGRFSAFELAPHGNAAQIRRAIIRGANFRFMTGKGDSPLYRAAESNPHPDAVRLMLEQTQGLDEKTQREQLNTALGRAAEKNPNPEVIKVFGRRGVYEHSLYLDENYDPPLFLAASSNSSPEVIKVLLDSSEGTVREMALKGTIRYKGKSLLECAAKNPYPQILQFLLDTGADVNAKDANGRTALMEGATYAAANTKALLNAGADVNVQDKDGKTAMMAAVLKEYALTPPAVMIEVLLNAGADVNLRDKSGQTVLTNVVQNPYKSNKRGLTVYEPTRDISLAAKLLLNAGADVNAQDKDGRTALMWATRESTCAEAIKLLLDAGANVNAQDKDGRDAIDFIGERIFQEKVRDLKTEIIRLLLEAGADDKDGRYAIDISGWSEDPSKELREAATHNPDPEIVKAILEIEVERARARFPYWKARPPLFSTEISNPYWIGLPPLFDAAGNNPNPEVVKVLLDMQGNERRRLLLKGIMRYEGRTLLQEAAGRNAWNYKVTQFLLDAGANVNARSASSGTALIASASLAYSPETVKMLVDSGANINLQDKDGKTALMYAAYRPSLPMIEILLAAGADVNIQDKDDRTALMLAARDRPSVCSPEEAVRLLLNAGADVSLRDKDGKYAVDLLEENKFIDAKEKEAMTKLLSPDIEGTRQLASGDTPLIKAIVDKAHPRDIRFLIRQLDEKTKRQTLDAAMMRAASRNPDPEVIRLLIDAGAHTGLALFNAARSNPNPEVIRALLDAESSIRRELLLNGTIRDNGSSLLTSAAMSNASNPKVTQFLLDAGADINAKDVNGRTALMMSTLVAYNPEVVRILVDAGAEVNLQDSNGTTALMNAAHRPIWMMTKILLDAGADVNLRDTEGRTALIYATREGMLTYSQKETVQLLLRFGADINAQGNDGKRAIDYAKENEFFLEDTKGKKEFDELIEMLSIDGK